jgi:hypothetical protein
MSATTSDAASAAGAAASTGTQLGHLALHYLPGDEQAARLLLQHLGCTLIDNGPKPGEDGFCTVLVDGGRANYADNIMFLSRAGDAQLALESAIRESLGMDGDDPHPSVSAFRDRRGAAPESASHIGLRFDTLDAIEDALLAIERDAQPGGPFEGRVEVTKYPPRGGVDEAIDARIAASPLFDGTQPPSFAKDWVQCFVKTDLFGYGILAFGQTIELDYVFDRFFQGPPPSFGR